MTGDPTRVGFDGTQWEQSRPATLGITDLLWRQSQPPRVDEHGYPVESPSRRRERLAMGLATAFLASQDDQSPTGIESVVLRSAEAAEKLIAWADKGT